MISIFDEVGADPEDYIWSDFAGCKNMDVNLFFDLYEEDPVTAMAVDELCATCPVAKFCLDFGMDTKSDGVFAGVYLNKGEVDVKYNAHKTDKAWKKWKQALEV
jgi:Transcription factor WhiB